MKSNKKNLMVFAAIAFFIASSLVFFFIYSQINVKNKNAEDVLLKWQTEYSKREEIKSLENFAREIEPEKALLETHFAQSSDVVPFLNTIEALAVKAGTKTTVSSVDVAQDNSGLIVGMQASGSFQAVYDFLMLLENSPYELETISLDMNKSQNASSGKSAWDAVFKIKLLSFIQ